MTETFSKIICVGLTLGFILVTVPAVNSQEQLEGKLGILNFQKIARTSLMTKDIARQKNAKRREFREEIRKEEQALRAVNDELQKQRVILTPEAYEEKVRKFQQTSVALQKKVQQRNQEFNRITAYTDRVFQVALQKALSEVAKKNNYILVLRRHPNVLVRADFLDITPSVLKALNKKMPSYNIPTDIEQAIKTQNKKAAANKPTGGTPKFGK